MDKRTISKKKTDLDNLKSSNSFKALKLLITELKEKYKFSEEEIIKLTEEKEPEKPVIPISIFENKKLTASEIIVKYLKENLHLANHEIALALNRNNKTIWTVYNLSLKKTKEKLVIKDTKFFVPISIFKDSNLTLLESIISYLKDYHELTYHKIAVLLRRDERNIWTIYQRSKRKHAKRS